MVHNEHPPAHAMRQSVINDDQRNGSDYISGLWEHIFFGGSNRFTVEVRVRRRILHRAPLWIDVLELQH